MSDPPDDRRPSTSTLTSTKTAKSDRADRVSIITLPDKFAQVTKSHRIIGMESPSDVTNPSHIKRRSLKPRPKKDSAPDQEPPSNPSASARTRRESTKSKSSNKGKEEPPLKNPRTKPKTAENIGSIGKGKKGNNENVKKNKPQVADVKKTQKGETLATSENSESDAPAAPVLKYKRPTLLQAIRKVPPEIVKEPVETKPPPPPEQPAKSIPDKKVTSTATATAAKGIGSKSAVISKADKSISTSQAPGGPLKTSERSNGKEVKGEKIEQSTSTSSQMESTESKEKERVDGATGGGRKGSAGLDKKQGHKYTAANKEQAELEVKASGYVNLPDFADALVDIDPYEIHSWVKDMTTKLYLYAVFLLIVASLLNAAMIFCFHLIPQIFAYDLFYRIFLLNKLNYGSAVAVMLCISILSVWFCFCLTIPNPTSACVRKGRWLFYVLIELYILWSLISQVYESRNIKSAIEDAMIKDLSMTEVKKVKSPTRLEVVTQSYFECCGIESHEDWRSYGHLNRTTRPDLAGGYPLSCCSREHPECSTPVTIYVRSDTEHDKIQLWTDSCLQREYYMVVATVSFVFILQVTAFISSILATLLLNSVINHTIIHNVGADETLHPFS